VYTPQVLTFTGGLITDAVRTAGVEGDGLTSPAGVGIWPAATNLITNGGLETNTTGWSAIGDGVIARSTAQAKFGAASLRLTAPIGGSTNNRARFVPTLSPSTQYTFSCWVYLVDAAGTTPQFLTSSTAGVATTIATIDTGLLNQWVRYSFSVTTTGTITDPFIDVRFFGTTVGTAGEIYIDGVQLETGSIATPYIETDGGTASRVAGRVQQPVAGLFTATQGWVALRFRYPAVSGFQGKYGFGWTDDGNNRITLLFEANDTWRQQRLNAGASGTAGSAAQVPTAGGTVGVVGAWTATQTRISAAGAAFVNAANANVPTLAATSADIGSFGTGLSILGGNYLWYATGAGTLTDTDAAALNAISGVPVMQQIVGAVGPAAKVTSVWPGVDTTFFKRTV